MLAKTAYTRYYRLDNIKSLFKLLRTADWYYQHSDNMAAFRRGQADMERITRAIGDDKTLQEIRDKFYAYMHDRTNKAAIPTETDYEDRT